VPGLHSSGDERRAALTTTGDFRVVRRHDETRVGVLIVAADAGDLQLTPARRVIELGASFALGRRPPPLPARTAVWAVRDGRVSSLHATIDETDDGFVLRDMDSTNGTLVDGTPVTRAVTLRDGALVFFGQHVAVFRVVSLEALAAIRREQQAPFGPLALLSPSFVRVTDKLRKLAAGDGEILLVGETGVGKEVYARAVHQASGRSGPFVAVNCAAIPGELVETELFGYVRGAHSQARESKPGLLDEADGGTLFLDEIGEMSPELQAKLLRFAQDRLLTPIGGTQTRRIDTRILAATNRLQPVTAAGGVGLRADLIGRLGAEPIELPPLRAHLDDLGVLVAHFLRGSRRRVSPAALRALYLHEWPGNVRELEKAMQEAEVLSRDTGTIDLGHLPARIAIRRPRAPAPLPPAAGTL
jgi:transcriptional regulator of aromatic amino acid metabolism